MAGWLFNVFKTQNLMAQGTRSHRLLRARRERFLIEDYALLTEISAPAAQRDVWVDEVMAARLTPYLG